MGNRKKRRDYARLPKLEGIVALAPSGTGGF